MQQSECRKFFEYYLPVLLWMGVIFYFSAQPGLKTGAATLTGEITLRKLAHLGEFAVLAILLWRIFFRLKKMSFKKSFFIALVVVLLYALTDEAHQVFVYDRAGRLADVAVDLAGGLTGLLLVYLFIKRK